MSDFLTNTLIDMFVFPLRPFHPGAVNAEHKDKVRYVENVGQGVIRELVGKFGSAAVLNQRIDPVATGADTEPVAQEIADVVFDDSMR